MSPIVTGGGGGSGGAISGVTVTGTAASGQVPVASSSSAGAWSYPPGFEISFTAITATITVSSTTESAGTSVVAPGAIVFDGTPVLMHLYAPSGASNTGGNLIICLFEGATQLGRIWEFGDAAINFGGAVNAFQRFTPTAASHTYTITAFMQGGSGNGSILAGAGGTGTPAPGFLRFTKV